MPIFEGVNLWQISRQGTQQYDTGSTLEFSKEPTGIAYDGVGERVFISDDDAGRVFEVTAGSDDRFGTSDDVVTSFSVRAFGNDDAEDVAYDSTSGDLFVAEGDTQEVWRVCAGPNGRFDGVPPTGDDTVSHFDVGVYGSIDVQGITYSPVRNSLFLADRKSNQVVEVSKAGALIQTIDVTAIDMHRPAGITLAPASDDTAGTSIYIVARGRDNNTYPNENDGTMYELSAPDLGPIAPLPNQAPSVSAGPDRAVTLPTSAILKGTVTDDGLPDPPGSVTITWSKVSGPGAVTFAHPHLADSTAGFSAAGTYVLRLSASDSALDRQRHPEGRRQRQQSGEAHLPRFLCPGSDRSQHQRSPARHQRDRPHQGQEGRRCRPRPRRRRLLGGWCREGHVARPRGQGRLAGKRRARRSPRRCGRRSAQSRHWQGQGRWRGRERPDRFGRRVARRRPLRSRR